MSLGHGSRIVTEGLVFAYDMGSKQSWKGKPTTNLLTTPIGTWGPRPAADSVALNETYKGGQVYRLQDADGVPDTYIDNYYAKGFTGLTQGDVYTFSMDVRVIKHPVSGSVANATNSIWIWYTTNTQTVLISDLPLNEWVRVEVTETVDADLIAYPRIDYDNSIIDVANLQFEKQDFATPFVDGTRSSTEAILDWKGGNTITVDSLTYNSDNTFSFTNTAVDKFHATHSADIDLSGPFTFDVWLNPAATQNNSFPYYMWKSSVLSHINQNPVGSYIALNISVGTLRQAIANGIINPDVWNHVVCSYDGQVAKIYHNGEPAVTTDFGSLAWPSATSADLYLGGSSGTDRQFNGDIASYKQYNRILTDQEVKQNFNALRSRFMV